MLARIGLKTTCCGLCRTYGHIWKHMHDFIRYMLILWTLVEIVLYLHLWVLIGKKGVFAEELMVRITVNEFLPPRFLLGAVLPITDEAGEVFTTSLHYT